MCALVLLLIFRASARADVLCDTAFQDCRAHLLNLIRNESVGIDVAFWFMKDEKYTIELIQRFRAGVRVRVLIDTDANPTYPENALRIAELRDAGIPIRERVGSGILHWKTMIFAAQNVVEFSGANYSAAGFAYSARYVDYVAEAVYFSEKPSVVNSFKSRFDDLWTNTTRFRNYANVTAITRSHAAYPKDPELNFPPSDSYAERALPLYNGEVQKIDVIMYRITDKRHANAMIAAVQRGVPVRLLTEPEQYRDRTRLWHSWNVDRLYMAGVRIKHRRHGGLTHQKSVLLYGQGMTIFGSSNWTSPSDDSQEEHNYFTRDPGFFQWFVGQFERKWNSGAGIVEYEDFVPLPPDSPNLPAPASGTTGVGTSGVTLKWFGGPFAHLYDVYFGLTPNPPLVAKNLARGPSETPSEFQTYSVSTRLLPGTTYYWRVVGKTMAQQGASSAVWSFTTTGTAIQSPPPPSLPPPALPLGPRTSLTTGSAKLLWQHADGWLSSWTLAGTILTAAAPLNPMRAGDPKWRAATTGDLNNDGQRDILWQHEDGWLAVWLMNGINLLSARVLTPDRVTDPDWRIVAVADLNKDGLTDIVWHHRTQGYVATWLMNGTVAVTMQPLTPNRVADTNWRIVGTAELNHDGWTDIVWQHQTSGQITAWLMYGATFASAGIFNINKSDDPSWKVRALLDADGDGNADFVWQHATKNLLAVTSLDGLNVVASAWLEPQTVSAGWLLIAAR